MQSSVGVPHVFGYFGDRVRFGLKVTSITHNVVPEPALFVDSAKSVGGCAGLQAACFQCVPSCFARAADGACCGLPRYFAAASVRQCTCSF